MKEKEKEKQEGRSEGLRKIVSGMRAARMRTS